MMQPRRCAECGAEFTPRQPIQHFCSKHCARIAKKRRDRSSVLREAEHMLAVSKPVPTACLMSARSKPANTSAVRWRIELRRRANSKHYADYGEILAH